MKLNFIEIIEENIIMIERVNHITKITTDISQYETHSSFYYVLNELLLIRLKSVESVLKATKRILSKTRELPFYVDQNNQFIVIKAISSEQALLVNVTKIVDIVERSLWLKKGIGMIQIQCSSNINTKIKEMNIVAKTQEKEYK